MHETNEIPLVERELAHKTLAELVVWVFSDENSSVIDRHLVAGHYVLVNAMVAGNTPEEREATFIEGLVAEGGSRDGARRLCEVFFQEETYRRIFLLKHIPADQKGFGLIRVPNNTDDLDEKEFIASILETFTKVSEPG